MGLWYTDGARSALRAALEMEGFAAGGGRARGEAVAAGGEALLPAFLCDTLLAPFHQHGLAVRFYDVHADLSVNLEDLSRRLGPRTRVVLFIHYFGFPQPAPVLRYLAALRRGGAGGRAGSGGARGADPAVRDRRVVIEDLTHTVWTAWALDHSTLRPGSAGDYVIASYRKFGQPFDGGFLLARDPAAAAPACAAWASPAHCLSVLAWSLERSGGARLATSLWQEAEAHYDRDRVAREMAPGSQRLLREVDPPALVARRRRAYDEALRRIEGCPHGDPLRPGLPDGVCPLVLPVRAHAPEERGPLRAWLARRGLTTVLLWPRAPGVDPEEFPGATDAAGRLVSVLLPLAPGENRAL